MPSEKRARQRAGREARLIAEAKAAKRRKTLRNSIIGVVLVGIVVGIVFLASSGNNNKKPASADKKTTTTVKATTTTTSAVTTTTASSADSAAQTAANAKAVAAGCPASPTTTVNTQKYSTAPAMTIDTTKTYSATVVTTAGTFTIGLDASAAPHTVNNFVFLANKGYYHCVIFHRVIPNFMDQTGDPTGTGDGTPGYSFANENIPKAYATGDVAMANSGGSDSNGSQFFIVVPGGATTLDADLSQGGYSLFGTVTSGLSVVEAINAQGTSGGTPSVIERMLSVTINES
jgi:cyclophilin family peptidyl-prolyl cis-trans isomerase